MRAVNLLPRDMQGGGKSIRQEDPAVVIGAALGLVVMIALGAAFMTAHGKAAAQQKLLTSEQRELAQFSEKRKAELPKPTIKKNVPITPIIPPPAITGQEAAWLSSVSGVLTQRIEWDRVLREVSLVMPDDVTLSSLTLTAPAPGVVAAGGPAQGLAIAGTAFSYESVARLLTRLALVPDLENVTLTNTSAGAATGGPGTTVAFGINAGVKGGPAPVVAPVAPVAPADTSTDASS